MNRKIVLLGLLLMATASVVAQINNQINQPTFRSLQTVNLSNWLHPPVIVLGSDNRVSIAFDDLVAGQESYYYSIVHCNRDWTPSRLSDMEFLDGFNNNLIENATPSFNTYAQYIHYRIELPNDKINFLLSGNYLCNVYRAEDPDKILLSARFFVAEKTVQVASSFTPDTDISFRTEHQQINVRVRPLSLNITTPQTDLAISVEQNNRPDTRRFTSVPLSITNNEIVYEHNRDLIFEGGNEYRRFEIVSSRYPGLNVDRIRYTDSVYNATLIADEPKNEKPYLYDRDQNGRFLVRDVNAQDNDSESDYFNVRFSLPTELPYINGRIYLLGEFTQNSILPQYEVKYDPKARGYVYDAFLKEGAYNYQYIMVSNDTHTPTLSPIEGSHYETENEYLTIVYYRPPGARYDRIVGYSFFSTARL